MDTFARILVAALALPAPAWAAAPEDAPVIALYGGLHVTTGHMADWLRTASRTFNATFEEDYGYQLDDGQFSDHPGVVGGALVSFARRWVVGADVVHGSAGGTAWGGELTAVVRVTRFGAWFGWSPLRLPDEGELAWAPLLAGGVYTGAASYSIALDGVLDGDAVHVEQGGAVKVWSTPTGLAGLCVVHRTGGAVLAVATASRFGFEARLAVGLAFPTRR